MTQDTGLAEKEGKARPHAADWTVWGCDARRVRPSECGNRTWLSPVAAVCGVLRINARRVTLPASLCTHGAADDHFLRQNPARLKSDRPVGRMGTFSVMSNRAGATKSSVPIASGPVRAVGGSGDGPSGRVAFDSSGKAVWEFRDRNQNFVREPSTTMVQKIQSNDLSLEQTGVAKSQHGTASAGGTAPAGPGDGWNPYERHGDSFGPTPQSTAAAAARKPSRIIVTKRSKPGLFERLLGRLSRKPE